MADVFVSYASEDRERVKPIVEAIEAAGFTVWWDRRIGFGSSFDREIERELEAASCIVVIWSERSVESDWVRNEAQEGLDRGVLLPILIEDVRPPLAFRRAQAAQLSRVSSEELSRVVAAVESILTGLATPSSHSTVDSPPRSKRWFRYLTGLAVGAVILSTSLWWSEHFDSDATNRVTNTSTQLPASVMCQNMVQRARFGADSLQEMLDISEQALARDPTCSGALAQKAFALSTMAEFGWIAPRDGFSRAGDAAEQALALDPNQPLAHTVLGAVHMRLDLDFQEAMNAFSEAEQLGATASDVASWKQDLLLNAGLYPDGLALQLQEERENPLDPGAKVHTARFFVRLHRHDEARRKLAEAIDLDNNHTHWERIAGIYLHDLGEIEEAQVLIETGQLSVRGLQWRTAQIAHARGDPEPLRDYLTSIESGEDFPSRSWALWPGYYELGNFEKHIRWFAVSVEARVGVSWIMDFMNYRHPDYWQVLDAWVAEEPAVSSRRREIVERHKELVMEVTEKMRI